jgi:D-glycero-alpha-D-manno-heptose-7-phosphate kinase
LENKGGRQDQWASVKGGFNHLLFIGDDVEPLPFEPMRSAKNWLHKHFVIFFSGIEHNSGKLHKAIWDRYKNGDEEVLEGLHCIRKAARTMANGLQQDRREMVVESLREVCRGVDMMDSQIHEPFLPVIQPLLDSKKVIAWKALGAGGGGSVGLLCSANNKEIVVEEIKDKGWKNIEWEYDDLGIVVEKKK